MKERYSEPQLEIITFSIADVISTSYLTPGDAAIPIDTHPPFVGGPNEGEFNDEWL